MSTFYITCRTVAWTPGCTHQHVASVGYRETRGADPGPKAATREEMIALLKIPGNEAYSYVDALTMAKVVIHTCRNGVEYLTTKPDATKIDNLEELPFCSR